MCKAMETFLFHPPDIFKATEADLLRAQLRSYEVALQRMAEDFHRVYPWIGKVAVTPDALVNRYLGYQGPGERPPLPDTITEPTPPQGNEL